jgi:streptogramin lyase
VVDVHEEAPEMSRIMLALAAIVAAGSTLVAAPAATGRAKPHPPAWTLPGHGGFAFGFGSAWIAGGGDLLKIDPRTNRITATISGTGAWPIARPDGIWTLESSALDRIDPTHNKIVARIPLPSTGAMAYGFGSFWITSSDGTVIRVAPTAHKVVATIQIQSTPNWSPQIATGAGAVWVASADSNEIVKINPHTNRIASKTPIPHSDSLLTVAVGYGSVWAHQNAGANGRGVLYRINPTSGAMLSRLIASKPVGGQYGGTDIALGAGSLWVANGNGTVSKITRDGTRILRSILMPLDTEFIATALGSLWIQDDNGQTARIPLTRFAT